MFQRHSTIPYPLTPTRLKIKSIEIKNEFSDDLEKTSRTYTCMHRREEGGEAEGKERNIKFSEKKKKKAKRRGGEQPSLFRRCLRSTTRTRRMERHKEKERERERDWRYSCRAPKPHRITHDPCFAADRRFEIFPN